MRKLIFIIVLFFSTSVLSVEYWAPCLKSSDLTRFHGTPDFHSGFDFYWFTKNFTAVCEVQAGEKEYCYINKLAKEFTNRNGIYPRLIATPENSCQ